MLIIRKNKHLKNIKKKKIRPYYELCLSLVKSRQKEIKNCVSEKKFKSSWVTLLPGIVITEIIYIKKKSYQSWKKNGREARECVKLEVEKKYLVISALKVQQS